MKTNFLAFFALVSGMASIAQADNSPWRGAYAGVSVTKTQSDMSWTNTTNFDQAHMAGTPRSNSVTAQLGYDWQMQNFVFGLYAEATRNGAKDDVPHPVFSGTDQAHFESKTMLSTGLRLGYAFDKTLLYVKLGAAKSEIDVDYTGNPLPINYPTSELRGRAFGLGIEHQLANNWSFAAEVKRYDFDDLDRAPTGNNIDHRLSLSATAVSIGFNRRF